MLSNGQTYFKSSCCVDTRRFLKYAWPYLNIVYKKAKHLAFMKIHYYSQIDHTKINFPYELLSVSNPWCIEPS